MHTEISLDSFTVIMILDDVKIKVCLCVEEHYSEIISQLVEAIFFRRFVNLCEPPLFTSAHVYFET